MGTDHEKPKHVGVVFETDLHRNGNTLFLTLYILDSLTGAVHNICPMNSEGIIQVLTEADKIRPEEMKGTFCLFTLNDMGHIDDVKFQPLPKPGFRDSGYKDRYSIEIG